MNNRKPATVQPLELAQQTKEHFCAILDKIEATLTGYHNGENVSLELALSEVSRLACDGHALALELHSKLNREGV